MTNFTFAKLFLIVVSLTAGCMLLMWMGELITQRGHRQRHLADDLRLDRLAPARRASSAWWTNPDQVFKVMMPFLALGGDRRDRVRAGGPAAHPGAVRASA